jgi:hypothetical protein
MEQGVVATAAIDAGNTTMDSIVKLEYFLSASPAVIEIKNNKKLIIARYIYLVEI